MTSTTQTAEKQGPHETPIRVPKERAISLAWNVGDPDRGQQPQAELSIHYFKGSGYVAQLKERREAQGDGWVTHHYKDMMGRPGLTIHRVEASRFAAKTLNGFAHEALAELRRRFDAADDQVVRYFDPESELHTP